MLLKEIQLRLFGTFVIIITKFLLYIKLKRLSMTLNSKYLVVYFISLLIMISCQEAKKEKANSQDLIFAEKAEDAKLISSDITLFWKAFDKQLENKDENYFEEYLEKGSIGLKDFIPNKRIESADALKSLVLSEIVYYNNIRSSSNKLNIYEKEIRSSFYALDSLYPEAIFPPVYFLIARTTSGGTASKNGLMIALEVYSDSCYTTNYGRPSLDIEILPSVVVHELIHFLQKDNNDDQSLLKHSIREGSADFITELVSSEKIKFANGPNVYSYGNAHEKELWLEFKKSMFSTDLSNWLYSSSTGDKPQNLGYWMGYKIVESYYENSKDKRKAIAEILTISDYSKFFKKSQYGSKIK